MESDTELAAVALNIAVILKRKKKEKEGKLGKAMAAKTLTA